jgi:hypothetical protein
MPTGPMTGLSSVARVTRLRIVSICDAASGQVLLDNCSLLNSMLLEAGKGMRPSLVWRGGARVPERA